MHLLFEQQGDATSEMRINWNGNMLELMNQGFTFKHINFVILDK